MTLLQWQQLAKPNLGGILHPRPGVLTKDFKELEVDVQHVYSLNDLEEDEPDLAHGLGRSLSHLVPMSPSCSWLPACLQPRPFISSAPLSLLCVSSLLEFNGAFLPS